MKKIIAVLSVFLFVFASQSVFAQNKIALTVMCNQSGAQVYISGRLMGNTTPNWSQILPAGTYQLKVSKKGYPDFVQTITLSSAPVTVNVNLGGSTTPTPAPAPVVVIPNYTLTITSNVPGAQVFVNGTAIGNAPASASLPAGNYSVKVVAPNYLEYNSTVAVNGNTSHNATLTPQMFPFSLSGNLNGAEVYLNGTKVGVLPFISNLAPGVYTIVVRANGYQEYQASITVNGAQNLSVNLIPMFATINVVLPAQFKNGDEKDPLSKLDLWVDGARQKGLSIQVLPGRHTIRLASGGISIESVLTLEPGRVYTLEPVLGLSVK